MATEVTCIVDTDAGGGHHYDELNSAIVGESGATPAVVTSADLAANDEQLTIELRASVGGADPTKASVTGFNESSTCFVKLKQASPHGGSWNTSVYRLSATVGANESVLQLPDNYTEVDGVQIMATPFNQDGSFTYYCINAVTGNNLNIHHGIIRGDFSSWSTGTSGSYGVYLGVDIGAPQYVKRNLIYGFNSPSTGDQAAIRSINHTSGKTYAYNNTIVDCRLGIMDGYSDIIAVNNAINDCTTCFSGSFDGSSDYNLSEDATAPGSNSVTSTSLTFADAANDDYHLASTDTAAIGAGIGPSSDANVPTTDIDGDAVSGTTCDIGADEYTASGGATNLVIADATHGHTADSPALTQDHQLVIADALHAHAADNLALTQLHVLQINGALHSHLADSPALTQDHQLVIAEALHAHAADNLTLQAGLTLSITDAAHAHSADNIALTQAHVLAIQEALHAHNADSIALTQDHTLIISDALHAHLADIVTLSTGSITVPTNAGILLVDDTRAVLVIADTRSIAIGSDDRAITIH